MINRVSIGHDGEMHSQELASSKVTRSTDYVTTGLRVSEGMGSKTITDASQADDNAVVSIHGMEMKVSMAKELGLLNAAIDESLSMGAAQNAAQKNAETPEAKTTGHEGYDATSAELHSSIEAGMITLDEGIDYENSIGEIALSGLTVTEVTDTLDGLADGSLSDMDVDANTRAVSQAVEARVTAAATKSAQAELGMNDFNRLAQITASNPEVNAALRQYASLRALGKADSSWSEFLSDVDDHLRGVR